MGALALDLVALERLHADQQVFGSELVVAARDRDCHRLAVAQRRRRMGRVQAGDRAAATSGICFPNRGPRVR